MKWALIVIFSWNEGGGFTVSLYNADGCNRARAEIIQQFDINFCVVRE